MELLHYNVVFTILEGTTQADGEKSCQQSQLSVNLKNINISMPSKEESNCESYLTHMSLSGDSQGLVVSRVNNSSLIGLEAPSTRANP